MNCFRGYKAVGPGKVWGTNNVENATQVLTGSNGSVTTILNNKTIVNLTVYNQSSNNPYEAQVIGGDSGSGVYHRLANGQLIIRGIVLAEYTYSGQLTGAVPADAIYGDATGFADLSSYASAISAIKAVHADYSIVGDLNLDGVVNSADITTFVANWGANFAARAPSHRGSTAT